MKRALALLLCAALLSAIPSALADDGFDEEPVAAGIPGGSGTMIDTATWASSEGWATTGSDSRVNPQGYLQLTAKGSARVTSAAVNYIAIPENFILETRVRFDSFSREQGIRMNTGKYRCTVMLFEHYLKCYEENGRVQSAYYDFGRIARDVKIVVEGTAASVFIDGEHVVDFTVYPDTASARLNYWAMNEGGEESVMYVERTLLYSPAYLNIKASAALRGSGIVYPGQSVEAEVTAASGNGAVEGVELYLGGAHQKTMTKKPYRHVLPGLPAGQHELYAVVRDSAGASRETERVLVTVDSGIRVTIQNLSPTGVEPDGTALISVDATADNGAVSRVALMRDGEEIMTAAQPQSIFRVPVGQIANTTLTAQAYDEMGNKKTSEGIRISAHYTSDWSDLSRWRQIGKGARAEDGGMRLSTQPGESAALINSLVRFPDTYLYAQSLTLENGEGALSIGLNNGASVLDLTISKAGIGYEAVGGKMLHSLSLPVGEEFDLQIAAFEGIGQVYVNGRFEFSYPMPYTSQNNVLRFTVTDGGSVLLGGMIIEKPPEHSTLWQSKLDSPAQWESIGAASFLPCGALLSSRDGEMTQISKRDQNIPQTYVLELQSKADAFGGDGELALRIHDSAYAFEMYLRGDGVYFLDSPLGTSSAQVRKMADIGVQAGAWHSWKVVTVKGLSQVYRDGALIANVRLAPESSAPELAVRVQSSAPSAWRVGSVSLAVHQGLYLYSDDFSDESTQGYWALREGEWDTDGGFAPADGDSLRRALLHTLAYQTQLAAQVAFAEGKTADFGILLRWFDEKNHLTVDYIASKGRFEARQTYKGVSTLLGQAQASLAPGSRHELQVVAQGNSLTVLLNGQPIIESGAITYPNSGRVGVQAKNPDVRFTCFDYRGDSKVTPDVWEGFLRPDLRSANSGVLDLQDGRVVTIWGDNTYMVTGDFGRTWSEPMPGQFVTNVMKLSSGNIIRFGSEESPANPNERKYYSQLSTDNGQSFSAPSYIHKEFAPRIVMPDRVSVSKAGRIFFPSPDHSNESNGSIRVIYSDDEGKTWTPSETFLSMANTGVNAQEATVVDLPDGTLKLYARTDRGYLYETTSADNGAHWDLNMKPAPFMSALVSFKITRDPYSGDYYMYWCHDNTNDDISTIQWPRQKLALAVSRDGTKTWEYVMDVDTFYGDLMNIYRNNGMVITQDHIFMFLAKPKEYDSTVRFQWYTVIDKRSIRSDVKFPNPKTGADFVSKSKITLQEQSAPASASPAQGIYAIAADRGLVYSGGVVSAYEAGAVVADTDIFVTVEFLEKSGMFNAAYSVIHNELTLRVNGSAVSVGVIAAEEEGMVRRFGSASYLSLTKLAEQAGVSLIRDGQMVVLSENKSQPPPLQALRELLYGTDITLN